ncbi:unnamed protein product, partial [Prunus brigantina]
NIARRLLFFVAQGQADPSFPPPTLISFKIFCATFVFLRRANSNKISETTRAPPSSSVWISAKSLSLSLSAVTSAHCQRPVASPPSPPRFPSHGPVGSQTPASSASSVAQPVSARRRHRPVSTPDTTSTDVSGSQPAKRNTRGPCRQLKTAKVTRVTNSRINIGYDERHRAAPTPELHSSLAH